MFRIEIFCDDKKLATVLNALTGLILGNPTVQPVANAKVKNGKVKALTNGTAVEMLADYIRKNNLEVLNAKVIKGFLKGVGLSPGSSSYLIRQGIGAGFLRKHGKGTGMTYKVIR